MTKVDRAARRLPANEGSDPEKPKYERLRQILVDEIAAGNLKPGDMLPPEQQLAEKYEIARSTVRQAMAELQRSGLITRTRGRGTFIQDDARQRIRNGLDVFALVLPETEPGFYPSLQRSFDEAAWRLHNQVLVCQTNNDLDRQSNVILQLIDKEVAGIAIVPTSPPPTPAYQIRQIQKAGIPVVFCSRRVEGIAAPLLAIPFREVGRLAGRAILDQGHRRVTFLCPFLTEASRGYLAGLSDAVAADRNASLREVFYLSEKSNDLGIHETELLPALKAILSPRDRPTVLFVSFDSLAESVYLHLLRMGLRVPEDISLVSFGGRVRNSAALRSLTSVTVDETQLGHRAVSLLDQMRRRELPLDYNESFDMPIGLSDGMTLGPVPRALKNPA